ncbi:Fis family transcriptional regulator [Gordonia sp. HNM0687]|uniref:Fis family transcriptional regulator n=1 Tax=Gordonia mangrovi TaxID=2665643 RepID=A0A6L7GNT5_9ACTN|nr:Fis family transcriptional regulator [Gordonia mangrovi]MXP21536.1 Fis family transcriptional regulator [Gordonia mangrovi]UVF80279.1 Fis family transcriptional regulator [Gordonia mangrovi]
MTDSSRSAHFSPSTTAVVIEEVTVTDKDVVLEAQRWTTGERGAVVDDPTTLADADLGEFVAKALTVGAHALSATGQAQESRALERMITELGDKATTSTAEAAALTDRSVKAASEAVSKAAADAQKALREADEATRKSLTESIEKMRRETEAELKRLFGGTDPEVIDRFAPLLEQFAANLDKRAAANTTELLTKAAKQFDPNDPASPMAKHSAELTKRQESLTEQLTKQHTELTGRLDEVVTALKVAEAKASVSKVSPIKGGTYETEVHEVLQTVAAGLGDEYCETGTVVGAVARSKKGDGVLTVDGGAARVVIEVTDSKRDGWGAYLDEAERNRQADAAVGLVRTVEQNCGETIRVLGKRRIVLAFDPLTDDPDLVRTVVMLLRTSALAVANRTGAHEIATAEEKITDAVEQLGTIDDIKKTAGTIEKNAQKIEKSCSTIYSTIDRLLGEALAALAGAADDEAESESERGAA